MVSTESEERWIGGIVSVQGFRHAGKPLRVAAWITDDGSVVRAAIVEGHGPTVLDELLTEALAAVSPERRPGRLVVWPRSVARRVEYPPVDVRRDDFLKVVIEDQACAGCIPYDLPVRRGARIC